MELSPTSFALLGLLAVRPWTTYELAHQARRSLRFFFPRAERHLYSEAKRLADNGFADRTITLTGKRRTTAYTITISGRQALREWLAQEPSAPSLEAEVLVRTFFADSGSRDDLLRALETTREQARISQAELAEMAQSSLDDVAPFPARASVGALSMRFVADFQSLIEQWATWAHTEVETWEDSAGRNWPGARLVFSSVAHRPAPDHEVGGVPSDRRQAGTTAAVPRRRSAGA
jgi:DNA-binding PadR family transcriptional regulator